MLCDFDSYFQIAAKINPQGAQNNQESPKKRPLEDAPGKNYLCYANYLIMYCLSLCCFKYIIYR